MAAATVASVLLWTVDGHVNAQQANRVPEFQEGDSTVRVVAEGTSASQNVGEPVEAVDPGDTLTYSLVGDDAGHFGIDSASGQLLTKSSLDYDTKSSYSVVVEVTDGADDADEADPSIDDTIEVTISVSVTIDLNDWTAEDYETNTQYCASGTWTVDSNGRAKETRGQAPSILHGDFDAYGKRLTATVHPGNDDDFLGFVVGFNGGDSTNADANYLLIDWKKSTQDFNFSDDSTSPGGEAKVGLRLSRVTGIPDCDEFWQHANLDGTADASGVEELQKGVSKGDSRYDRQNYEFAIDFGSESIEVYLDGCLELDLEGEFSDGRFGAYAMLHNSATFWDFSYTDGSFPSVSEPVDQLGEVSLSSTISEVGVALTATLTDPDGGVLNKVWQWESSPDQDPPTWTTISGATSASYIPTTTDVGKLLRASVTYDDATGTGRTAVSAATAAADQVGTLSVSTDNPVVGEALMATLTDADGGITNQVWVWEGSPDEDPLDWSVITGADSATYTPVASDAGRLLRARVTYDDTVGTGRSAITEATDAVDQRGAVTLSPVTAVVGEAVTAVLADADGGVANEVWEWERSPGTGEPEWSVISDATSSSYTPTASDDAGRILRVTVGYADGTGGGRSATSGTTDRVDQRGVVTLSTSVPDAGIEVAATLADADGGVAGEAWQWESSPSMGTEMWTDIADATASAYTPASTDEGNLLRVTVSYDDAVGGGRSATSASTQKVGKPGVVSLDSSMPVVGEAVNAILTDDDGSVSSEAWQWESSPAQENLEWADITDATSAIYTPVSRDAGRLLRVVVTYTDGSGAERMASSLSTARVDARGMVMVMPELPVVGKPVRATLVDSDRSITNEEWKWERSPGKGEQEWTTIIGAQSGSYTPTETDDSGRLLRVVVTYDDGTGNRRTATSEATKRVDREGMVIVDPSPPVAGQPVTATLTDSDGMVTNEVWLWERSPRTGTPVWEVISRATEAGYTPMALEDGGKILRVTVSYDDAIGTGRVAVSASTRPVDRPGVITLTTSMPVVGEAVVATLMDADGGILNAVWQWESSSEQDPPEWVAILGAESATYTPSASLAGKLLRSVVTYDDATGSGRKASSDGTEALDQRGTITLSSDAPVVGDDITATLDDLDDDVANEVWQWESSPDEEERTWSVITGADSATYTPVASDAGLVLRAMVSYDDAVGTGRRAVSAATVAVDQKGAVTLSPQQPVVGEAVTATLEDSDGGVSVQAWEWERSPGVGVPAWSSISGADSASYMPIAPDDAGKLLRVTVAYSDGTGSGRGATSAPTERVDQRGAVTLSTIVPDVGIAVMATLADADGVVMGEAWQWESSPSTGTPTWSDIADAMAFTYMPTTADEGQLLRATVGYGDSVGGERSATSAGTQKIGKPGVVSVDSSMPVVGESLTATLTDDDGSVSSEVWQWESSPALENPEWTDITDATSSSYTPVSGDAGKRLRVVVTYTDGSGAERMARSAPTGRVDQLGIVTVSPQTPVVGKPTRAELVDPDGSTSGEMWRWERSAHGAEPELVWATIAGVQSNSYTPVAANDSGMLLRATVTYDDGTGTGRTATSSATERVDRDGMVTVSPSPPVAGQAATAMLTDADGMVSNQEWKWERSPRTDTLDWEEITGATSATYTPTAADDGGKILRVTVGYDDAIGTGRGAVSPSTLAVDRLGVITLTTSMPVVGEALTATLTDGDGEVLNALWQWESSPDEDPPVWTTILGAESATYTPSGSLAGKLLRAVVTYDDATGRGREASSDGTAVLDQRGTISLSSDAPIVGDEVTATLEDLDGGVANEVWQWESSPDEEERTWSVITGAEADTYTVVVADAGRVLRAMVSYDDDVGMGRRAVSAATVAVDQKGAVTLSPQQPVVGEAVTATLTDADGDITSQAWQWERSPGTGEPEWSAISGAQSSSYTPIAPDDAGKVLRVVVTYTDGTGSGRSGTSAPTERVDRGGEVMLSTSVPDVGIAVTATLADPDGGVTGVVWQWERSVSTGTPSWSAISDADAAAYTPVVDDEEMALRATASYDDAIGSARNAISASTQNVGKPGEVSLDSTIPVVGDELTATLTDLDGSLADHVWQWESSLAQADPVWSSIAGASADSYTPVAGDAGKRLRVVVSYTDGSGSGRMAAASADMRVDQRGTVSVKSRNMMVDMPEVGVWQDAELIDPDGMVDNEMWQWEISPHGTESERVWMPVPGAKSSSYKPVEDDAGNILRMTVTYDDGAGSGKRAVSLLTERVDQPGTVDLSTYTELAVGKEVIATLTDLDEAANETWQWHSSPKQDQAVWDAIEGAVFDAYTPTDADGAKILRVTVSYDDGVGLGRTAESPSTGVVDRLGVVTLSTQTPEAGGMMQATLADGDGGIENVGWHWESSTASDEPSWEPITGAELAAYNPPLRLAGMLLRAVATYDDATASRTAASIPTGPLGSPGVVTLDSVEPVVGTAVTATLADPDGGVTDEAWRWERSPNHPLLSWTPIPGAVSKSYAPSAGDAGMVLSAIVTYSDALATGRMAWSGATAAVDQPGEVNLSPLEPEVGEPVRAMLVDLDEGVTGETWEWHRSSSGNSDDWLVIVGAVAGSYTPMTGDAGYRLRARVTYSDNTGTGRSATSGPTSSVYQPGTVVLSPDAPKVGEPVTARFSHPESAPEEQTWSWESSPGTGEPVWTIILGATAASYTPVTPDAGRVLRAGVTYRDGNGTNRSAASGPTARVDQRGMVTLSPAMPVVGEVLTATLTDPDEDIAGDVWLWEKSLSGSAGSWVTIDGVQLASYTPVAPADVGAFLRVTVTYSDGIGTGRTAVSAPTDRVDQRGAVLLSSNVPDVGVQLTATLIDPDRMVTNAEWQWQWSPSSGLQSWSDVPGAEGATYSPTTADEGMLLRATVVYDDATGGGRVVASPSTDQVGKPGVVSFDSGLPVAGTVLTAMLTDPDDGIANVVWQWESSAFGGEPPWEVVAGAESAIYTPQPSDAGRRLRAAGVYSDARGDGRTARSLPTSPVDREGAVSLSTYTPEVGTEVVATLTDPDGDVANETWQWESSPNQPEPVWAPIAVAMSHRYIPQSSNHGNLLRATVTYDDGTGTGRKAASVASGPVVGPAVVVTLSALAADAAPAVVLFNFPPSFAEGEEASREIEIGRPGARAGVPVMATDLNGDGLTYLLTGRDSAFFEVDPASGQVRIAKRLIYLRPGVYQVTLHAADPEGGVGSLVLSITVLQLTVPVFGEGTTATRTVPENSPVDTVVGFPVQATDPDGDTLAYTLSGIDDLAFRVDAGTGQIRTREILDREIRPTYRVEVEVEDGRGGRDSIGVNIEVSDVNEPPIFSSLISADFIVRENSPSGTAIGEPFMALDPEEDRLAYFLSGDDASAFEIGTSTGQVMTKERLDHESRASYGMKVGVEDGRGGSDEVGLSIEVRDVNEAPIFSRETVVVLALPENSPAGAVVGEPLLANDPEGDALAYSLSGDGAGAFAIEAETGLMLAKRPFDFESRSSYLVRVTAGDGIGGDGSIYVTVNVMDVEELVPEPIEEAISKSTTSADVLPASDADTVPDVIAPVDIVSSDSTDDLSTGAGTAASSRSDSGPASPFTDFRDTGPEAAVVTTEVVATVEDWEPVAVSEEGPDVDDTAGVAPTIVISEDSISDALPVAPPPVAPVVVRPATAPQPFPLWLVLVIIALVCLDGIVLATLFYRVWGRPRPR